MNIGLLRCGKSCRLRWMNYLRPDIKRGNITADEDDLIIKLHALLGNRWSLIAGRLPGRTDNEIKNYWNSHLSKRLAMTTENVAGGGVEAKKGKIITITSNTHENGETSSNAIKPTRVSPFCNDDSSSNVVVASGPPLPSGNLEGNSGGPETGMAEVNGGGEEEIQKLKAGRSDQEMEESGDFFGGSEVLYKGCSWNCSMIEDESYEQLLNIQGEDYIQLESFIDYFLI